MLLLSLIASISLNQCCHTFAADTESRRSHNLEANTQLGHSLRPFRSPFSLPEGGFVQSDGGRAFKRVQSEAFQRETAYIGTPRMMVFPNGTKDVQAAMRYASKHDIQVRVTSGGHSYYNAPLQDGVMLIVMRNADLCSPRVVPHPGARGDLNKQEGPSRVRIQAWSGCRMLPIIQAAYQCNTTVVMGDCSNVGFGGFVLGGGAGPNSNSRGFASDQLVEAELVTTSGTILTASEHKNRDILWALRGSGGGMLGVATYLTIEARNTGGDVERALSTVLCWPQSRVTAVLKAYWGWMGAAITPSPWFTAISVGKITPGERVPREQDWCLEAHYDGPYARGHQELMAILDLFPPIDRRSVQPVDVEAWAKASWDEWEAFRFPHVIRSGMVPYNTPEAMENGQRIIGKLATCVPTGLNGRIVPEVVVLGGALAANSSGVGGSQFFRGQGSHLYFEIWGVWAGHDDGNEVKEFVNGFFDKEIGPELVAGYINALDPGLKSRWQELYYGSESKSDTFKRLEALRAELDPRGILAFDMDRNWKSH